MLELIGSLVINLFLYGTGKLLLPVVSFGRWKADLKKSRAGWLSGWPYWRKGDDGIVWFSLEGACLFGVLFWILVILLVASFTA
jgi:hypothetical protein